MNGTIEITLPRAATCTIAAQAQAVVYGGLNWTRLLERSTGGLHGELGGGGTAIKWSLN